MSVRIHPTALVDPGARLGVDVSVGPGSIVGPDVTLGDRTRIDAHALVTGWTTLGAGNHVHHGAVLGSPPQDLKYSGRPSYLVIGDRNVFRECCTINRGTTHGEGVTRLGSDGLYMAYTHVAHDCTVGDKVVLSNCATMGGHVEIGDWVQLGGLSAIHQFCKIGAHAFIGGGAIVTRDVPPYVMIAGNPAEPHSVNAEGLKRRGFGPQQIRNIRNAYRILYRSELTLATAVEQLTALAREQPELATFVEFIGRSTRSLVR